MAEQDSYIIHIDGQQADLGDRGIKIPLFKSGNLLTDSGDVSDAQYSFTFELPCTDTNVRLLGFINLEDYADRFFSTVDRAMRISSGAGTLIAEGIILAKSVQLRGPFSCIFVGAETSWMQDLQGRSLRDLDLGELNYLGIKGWEPGADGADPVSIITTILLPSNGDATQTTLQFPIISYGNFYDPDTPEAVPQLNYKLAFEDIPPSVFVRPIVQAIFAAIGLTIVGRWIDSLRMLRLLQPFTGEADPPYNWGKLARAKAQHSAPYTYEHFDGGATNVDFPIALADIWLIRNDARSFDYSYSYDIQVPSAGNDWDGQDYSCPQDGFYQFASVLDVTEMRRYIPSFPATLKRVPMAIVKWVGTGGDVQVTLRNYIQNGATIDNPNILAWIDLWLDAAGGAPYDTIRGVGDVLINTIDMDGVVGPPDYYTGAGIVELLSAQVELKRGDKIKVIFAANPSTSPALSDFYLDLGVGTYFEVTYPDGAGRMVVADILPDMDQRDFVINLMKLHGLQIMQDKPGGQVLIESDNDGWMLPKQQALDLDLRGRWELGESEEPAFKSEYAFTWANDSADGLLKSAGDEYANYHHRLNMGRRAVGRQTVAIDAFAATAMRDYLNQFQIDSILTSEDYAITELQPFRIPTIASEEQLKTPLDEVNWDFKYMPRLLYWLGQVQSFIRWADFDPDVPVENSVPMEIYLEDQTIDFLPASTFVGDDDNPTLDLRWNGETGGYEVFYSDAIFSLLHSYIHQNELLLYPDEFFQLNTRLPIRFAGKYFRLIAVEGYELKTRGRTKFRLSLMV